MAADGVICDGDHLVLDVNGEKLSFVQKLKANGTMRVGKYTVSTAPLIGAPFGALFEVTADGKSLQRVLLPPADEITRITDTERDNSNLFDRNTENQKLTQEQIEELKKSGKAGSEIVDLLCSNSATFEKKTEFAQDKYKRRKAKKYITYLTPRKPTARMISEAYYDKCPERVWNLRHDTLAVMLSLGNVAAGAKVLVVEHCLGLVTAAAVERLGGQGAVCATQLDERAAPLDAMHPTALLDAIWPLLAPSATFAVYSPWAQPLAEALAHLQGSRNAVMLQLQESWLRPHQVLPARTHPHMTCSGSGGYLLSGIKVPLVIARLGCVPSDMNTTSLRLYSYVDNN
eukprot:XP_001694078.1 predicted protein [Chlamydomonas reinhardtii]